MKKYKNKYSEETIQINKTNYKFICDLMHLLRIVYNKIHDKKLFKLMSKVDVELQKIFDVMFNKLYVKGN